MRAGGFALSFGTVPQFSVTEGVHLPATVALRSVLKPGTQVTLTFNTVFIGLVSGGVDTIRAFGKR